MTEFSFNFAWLWFVLLLPLPLFIRQRPKPKVNEAAIALPYGQELTPFIKENITQSNNHRPRWLLWTCWILLILCLMRPQWLGQPLLTPHQGRDLLIAIDISLSMQAVDMRWQNNVYDRLTAVKAIVAEFIKQRQGDNIGLIVFGSNAYLQSPLTHDTQAVLKMLEATVIGLAGRMTAIGDAIGLGIKYLKKQPGREKVMILLTDGANTAGNIKPVPAAQLAQKQRIKIYTIGVGAEYQEVNQFFGQRVRIPNQELDETTLKNIAEATSGKYYRATDTQSLQEIYQKISALEPVSRNNVILRPKTELYPYPLTLLLLLNLALLLWPLLSFKIARLNNV